MNWDYVMIAVLMTITIMIILYLVGERSWGKQLTHRTRIAFWVYRKINRLRFNMLRNHKSVKNVALLHLMKASAEITDPNPDFNKAKKIYEETTIFKLVDIFDDRVGHRYIMIDVGQYGGKYIFEIMEYIRVAYNQKIKASEIEKIPDDKEEYKKELETKPILRIIK